MNARLLRVLLLLVFAAAPALAAGRRVIFVDNSRTEDGDGSLERPFKRLASVQAVTRYNGGEVIYVAQGNAPYDESFSLQRGQMLIGSAFGLDAVRDEFHLSLEAPPMPAAEGTGPVIHGILSLAGDNVVAGCTMIADKGVGISISAQDPMGAIALRTMFFRTSKDAYAIFIGNNLAPVSWTSGRIDATDGGSGILVNGGSGNVTFDHVAVSGNFGRAIDVRNRAGGTVLFHNASPVKIGEGSREGVVITSSRGAVRFDSPLHIRITGGRGLAVRDSQSVAVAGGDSWIESTNGTALDVRDAGVDMFFDRVSAQGVSPGRLIEGIVADKVRGRFEIAEGAISSALSYGMRLTQSAGLKIRKVTIVGGGTAEKRDCPPDVVNETNVQCRAAVYLRHIERSSFENITIGGNAGVGLNANNLIDVSFTDLTINRTGADRSQPAVLLDELRGGLIFTRCSFLDGAGGAVVIEQRFNAAQVTFDRCEIGAPQRPASAPWLVRAEATGFARLDLRFLNAQMHDNAGGGVSVLGKESASLAVTIRDSSFTRLGSSAVDLRVIDSASGCFDAAGNAIASSTGPAVRLGAGPRATLSLVGADPANPAGSIGQRNGGIPVVVEASATSVTKGCP